LQKIARIPLDLIENDSPFRISSLLDVKDLRQSLSSRGQLSPIRIRPHPSKKNKFQLIFGARRLEAAKQLGWATIEAEVTPASDSETLILAFSENSDRKDFTDFEKAMIIQKLHELTGKSYAEVAELVGRSASFVSQHVAMLKLFPENMGATDERKKLLSALTEMHARVLSRIEDPTERWNTAKLVVASAMSARELMRFYNRKSEGKGIVRSRRLSARKAIQEAMMEMINGMNYRDVELCVKPVARDFSLYDDFPPYDKMDLEEAKNHFLRVMKSVDEYNQRIEDVQLKLGEKFAYATVLCSYDLSSGGRTARMKSRGTLIFEKEEDLRWKVVHQHWSTLNPEIFLNFPFKQIEEVGTIRSMDSMDAKI
jgi:ParB family transcriptional regulator, chromosome partitioning protein